MEGQRRRVYGVLLFIFIFMRMFVYVHVRVFLKHSYYDDDLLWKDRDEESMVCCYLSLFSCACLFVYVHVRVF